MLKQIPERITYAQEKIIKIIKERKLRQWCLENALSHSAIYRIGMGEQTPSYKIVCTMVHLISPIEWLFYTDEKLPYEAQVVPQWNPENKCKFIKENKYNYKEMAKKYDITELAAYNIFVSSRAMPSLDFIKKCCKDVNPIDFFIDGEEPLEPKKFTPDRGDIINIQGNILLVISKKEKSEIDGYINCFPILKSLQDDSIQLINSKTKGFIKTNNIQTYILAPRCQAYYIETISESTLNTVLEEARKIFD